MTYRIVPAAILATLILTAAIVAVASTVAADQPGPYQPMGAPADPKVPARWNRYHDYAQVTSLLKSLAAAHPKRARLRSLGKSYGGREMWVLTITNFDKGSDQDKPAFWIDGAIHADEVQAVEVTLYTAWYLLEMYGRNPFITQLVDRRAFYLLPMLSPDSRDAHMYEPNTTSSPRSGQRPVDDDRDGLVDEDGPDDLDGDGHITEMRIRDPNGRWKPHSDHPQLLVRAGDQEPGQYRKLGTEGFDNDDDGRVNEDGDGFYDPNRDWAWQWQPGHIQHGAYRYPFSILENRMAAEFVIAHPNIAGAVQYHNHGAMILRGPCTKEDRMDSSDVKVHDAIAKKGRLILSGYSYRDTATGLYQVHGGAGDWFFAMRGVYCYTVELFTSRNYFHNSSGSSSSGRRDFDKYLLFGQGTVPWREVDHPQYGKIEVGGLKKQWGREPPSFLLEEECHRNMAFTLFHADQMPQVEIQSVDSRPIDNGLVEVTAVVVNRKLTPTHAAVDVKRKITPPDLVSIEGKRLEVVTGLQSDNPLMRGAKEQKRQPGKMRIATIGGMSAVYVRWLVKAEGTCTVSVRSVKGGSDQRKVRGWPR